MACWSLRFADPGGIRGAVLLAFLADHAEYWAIVELDDGVVVVRDDDVPLPRGALLEVRAEGLWAELVCEVPGVHWGFGLEAFGLRLDDLEEARAAQVGDRVAVGLDLEWDEGRVVGQVLVGARRIPVDGNGTFEELAQEPTWGEWLDGR
ncbi:MAG: hypothetical protein ACHQDE_01595 [Acidimicrobiia bacterium]